MGNEDYFLNCHSEESIKIRWRDLSKKWHPDKNKDPKAKEIFQEISNQRDKALRLFYKRSGLTDQEIDAKIDSFLEEIFSGKFSEDKMNSIVESMGKQILEEHDGKDLSFGDIFKIVSDKFMAPGKKKVEGKDPGAGKLNEKK